MGLSAIFDPLSQSERLPPMAQNAARLHKSNESRNVGSRGSRNERIIQKKMVVSGIFRIFVALCLRGGSV